MLTNYKMQGAEKAVLRIEKNYNNILKQMSDRLDKKLKESLNVNSNKNISKSRIKSIY